MLDPFLVTEDENDGYLGTRSISGARTNTLVNEMAQAMTVLSSKLLEDIRPEKVGDATRYISSAAGRDERDDANILIRGFGASVLADSFVFNPGREASWDLSNIDRVEVVKGASAVLYGSTTPGGVINLERKRPLPDSASSVAVEVGENSFYRGVVDVTGPLVEGDGLNVNHRAVLAYEDTESWRPFSNHEKLAVGLAADLIFDKNSSLLLRYEYQLFDGLQNFAQPFATTANADSPTLEILDIPVGFFRGEPTDNKKVSNQLFSTDFRHYLSSDWVMRWFNAYLLSNADRRETFITAPALQPDGSFLWDRFTQFIPRDTRDFYTEFNLSGKTSSEAFEQELLFGARFRGFHQDRGNTRFAVTELDGSPEIFDLFNPTYGKALGAEITSASRDQEIDQKEFGIYFQDVIKLMEGRLRLIGGLRWDRLEITNTNNLAMEDAVSTQSEGKWSPRYGAVFKATEDLTVYASVNESFLPSSGAGSFDGTPFDPPTAEQKEIGARLNLFDSKASVSVSLFQLAQQNLTVSDPINPGFQIQTGELESEGFEIDFRFNPMEGLQIIAGFGNLEAIVSEDTNLSRLGNQLRGVPETTGHILARYDFLEDSALEGLGFAFGISHVGDAPFADNVANPVMRPSYEVANLTVDYKWDNYKVSLDVDNLFDEEYFSFNGGIRFAVPGDARWVKLQFKADF